MKHATRWIILASLFGVFAGCQSPESAADNAAKTVNQDQHKVDHIDRTLPD